MKYVCFDQPMWTESDPICGAVAFMLPEECIAYQKVTHPQYPYTDEEALDDFMVVNWAWFVDLDENDLPWNREYKS